MSSGSLFMYAIWRACHGPPWKKLLNFETGLFIRQQTSLQPFLLIKLIIKIMNWWRVLLGQLYSLKIRWRLESGCYWSWISMDAQRIRKLLQPGECKSLSSWRRPLNTGELQTPGAECCRDYHRCGQLNGTEELLTFDSHDVLNQSVVNTVGNVDKTTVRGLLQVNPNWRWKVY